MDIEKKEPLVRVTFRIPPGIRKQVRDIAREKGVKEGTVYRAIVDKFFSSGFPQNVENKTTKMGNEAG